MRQIGTTMRQTGGWFFILRRGQAVLARNQDKLQTLRYLALRQKQYGLAMQRNKERS